MKTQITYLKLLVNIVVFFDALFTAPIRRPALKHMTDDMTDCGRSDAHWA